MKTRAVLIFSTIAIAGAALFFFLRPASDKTGLKAAFRRPEKIPFPSANPFSEEKYRLGKILFFDPRMSRSGMMACASCHNPSLSWTDGMAKGVGHGHQTLARRVPTLLNGAWNTTFFWDGRAATLEEQALGPIQAEAEMNMKLPELVDRLEAIPEYAALFDAAFPRERVSGENIARAIATYERTIVSDLAPFDYWIEGDESAISEGAKRGFVVFNKTAGCVKCHTGWNFTNGIFADVGIDTTDLGRGKVVGSAVVEYAFKAPTLRNIARRGPYMHDGSIATLRRVVDNYDAGGTVRRPMVKIFLKPLGLTSEQKTDLLSFLGTLTSEDEAVRLPSLPRGEWQEDTWKKVTSSSR